jgi:hypothetical protein
VGLPIAGSAAEAVSIALQERNTERLVRSSCPGVVGSYPVAVVGSCPVVVVGSYPVAAAGSCPGVVAAAGCTGVGREFLQAFPTERRAPRRMDCWPGAAGGRIRLNQAVDCSPRIEVFHHRTSPRKRSAVGSPKGGLRCGR